MHLPLLLGADNIRKQSSLVLGIRNSSLSSSPPLASPCLSRWCCCLPVRFCRASTPWISSRLTAICLSRLEPTDLDRSSSLFLSLSIHSSLLVACSASVCRRLPVGTRSFGLQDDCCRFSATLTIRKSATTATIVHLHKSLAQTANDTARAQLQSASRRCPLGYNHHLLFCRGSCNASGEAGEADIFVTDLAYLSGNGARLP